MKAQNRLTIAPLSAALLALALSGCSSATSGITTSSIFGGSAQPAAAPTAPVPAGPTVVTNPTDRALQVAAVSARAQKCGYSFDAQRLRTSYLNSEVIQGADAVQLTQVTKAYDVAHNSVAAQIAKDDDYCTSERTGQIKPALTHFLAGDFTITQKPKVAGGGWFGDMTQPQGREVLNPEWINDPKRQSVTKRVEN